jgi:hypothetical protein
VTVGDLSRYKAFRYRPVLEPGGSVESHSGNYWDVVPGWNVLEIEHMFP